MKKTNGKTILIFLLALAWLGLMVFVYVSDTKETQARESIKNNFSTEAYSNEELRELAREMNNKETTLIRGGDFSITSEPELENIVSSSKEDFETSQLQENFSFIIATEDNFVQQELENDEIPSNTLQVQYNISKENSSIKQRCGDFLCYTSREFLNIYDTFIQNQNLDFLSKYIYQMADVDTYIKQKAEERGYKQRSFARESDLIWFENIRTRPEVKKSYIALRNEMLNEGIRLHFVSGYRSSVAQRSIFKNKLNITNPNEILTGIHDKIIDVVLSRSAIPAYSKHHSGYAVDFGCGNEYLVYSFAETECYEWMSENNFENTKKHGFIPSYPENIENQGPNPEPWEFVWVGEEYLQ